MCPGVDEITELIEDKVGGHVDALLNERFWESYQRKKT